MIEQQDQIIVENFAERVRFLFPDAMLWIFGSRARGDAEWDSDLDLLIVLSKINPQVDRAIRDIAWEIGFEKERVITTVLMDKEEFVHGPMSESTLVDNVLREGFRL